MVPTFVQRRHAVAGIGTLAVALAMITWAADREGVDPDGTLHIRDLPVPLSSFLSPEARSYMLHLLRDQPFAGGPSAAQDIQGYRARQDEIMNWFLKPIRKRYPVNVEHKTIAGIYTDIVTPKDGVAPKNRNRVLLNMHGGGFVSGARTAALVESIPVASVEKIKVITIDYRMGPEYKFPAASEDVAAVYKEILKEYSPQHIGLYGCSAGGMLTAMSIAWFQKNHLAESVGDRSALRLDRRADRRRCELYYRSTERVHDSGWTPRIWCRDAVPSGIFEQRRS